MPDIEKVDFNKLPQGMPSSKFLASQIMEEMGYNPIKRLVEIAGELQDLPEEFRDRAMEVGIAKELAKYYSPTMRAVDVNISQNSQMTVNITRFDYGPEIPATAAAKAIGEIVDAVVEEEFEETEDDNGD